MLWIIITKRKGTTLVFVGMLLSKTSVALVKSYNCVTTVCILTSANGCSINCIPIRKLLWDQQCYHNRIIFIPYSKHDDNQPTLVCWINLLLDWLLYTLPDYYGLLHVNFFIVMAFFVYQCFTNSYM